jgi:hypothetical protein
MNDWKKLANPTFEEVEVGLGHSHRDHPQLHNPRTSMLFSPLARCVQSTDLVPLPAFVIVV